MNTMTRRECLKASALLGSAVALPNFAIGQSGGSPNRRLNIALIGAGGIAKSTIGSCSKENVVAIAEVDEVRGEPCLKAFPRAKRYKDFRKLFDAHGNELDLAIISTPDHTHFAATFAAMERGIAVHTQNPLVQNLWQARTLRAAAREFKVQTVMGNQGHNFEGIRLIKDWYDAGLAGAVHEVHAWTNRKTPNNKNRGLEFPEQPVPPTLEWDLWQGPVPARPYNRTFVPHGWRWHWDYGLGGLGDIGCHTLDIPVFCLGLGFPTAVYLDPSLDFRHEFDGKPVSEFSATYVYEFAASGGRPPLKIYWYEGGRMPKFPQFILDGTPEEKEQWIEGGCMLVGDKNTIMSPGMRAREPRMLNDWDDIRRQLPEKTTPRPIGNPLNEIIAAVKGEIPRCGSNFNYAVPLTEVVILGTLAFRFNKRVEYLPRSMRFRDSSLDPYVKSPVRPGWEYGEGLI